MPTMRLFVAVEIPEEERRQLARLISKVKPSANEIRWLDAEQFHVTLAFLGDVETDMLAPLLDALTVASETSGTGEVNIIGLGAFPNPKRPKIVFAGVRDPDRQLVSLQQRIADEILALGFRGENRPFVPHVTLGRRKSNRNLPTPIDLVFDEFEDFAVGTIPMEEFVLMESRLSPAGSKYSVVARFPLSEQS